VASPLAVSAEHEITFGTFRLLQAQRLLLEGDRPVPVGSRALALLFALVERAGEVLSKEELFAKVWPDTFVEEGNLRVHVAALRRALNDGREGNRYVVTVPGRGYSFVAPTSSGPPAEPPVAPSASHNLPPALTGMVGRDDIVRILAGHMAQRRFVTVAGPGGIGKTTVAVAAAQELLPSYRDGVAFIDFVPVADPLLVPGKLASVLGLSLHAEDPLRGVIAFLKSKELLLVLDNCEHVIEQAANLAEEVFRNAPGVHIRATSREPLRAAGERVHRLAALEGAPVSSNLTAARALTFPGIELFVDRASAATDEFNLTDENAPSWPTSADVWTGYRSRSSSPRDVLICSGFADSPNISTTVSDF
jgi:DNA-binding winged helix-turn-helix (wHTH) protein